MFRDSKQRAEACRTLLGVVDQGALWGNSDRPSAKFWDVVQYGLEKGLSSGEVLIVRVAADLWNNSQKVSIVSCLDALDSKRKKPLWTLLSAINDGPDAVDGWIQTWKGVEP
jgi:hypothetical protein